MSDLTKLKEILDNQQQKGVKSGDWKQLDYIVRKNETCKDITLTIINIQVGFVFTLRGRLIGMYNWKE